ncbi:MAG: hypothetical protein PUC15_08160 [Lentisphaeria bacterium]|nr:hypothetical protein [Lentisphaeria bacterium]
MNHTQDMTGKIARITEPARWTNYGTPEETLPAGTVVFIESWRPEGFNVRVARTNKYFFLFKEYVKTAQEIRTPDNSDVERIAEELAAFWAKQRETLYLDLNNVLGITQYAFGKINA